MNRPNDGGPAFPTYGADEDRSAEAGTMSMYLDRRTDGMTLRDYFAAHAMKIISDREPNCTGASYSLLAKLAYQLADDMIAEGQKERA